jgi:hypothetical protein
MKQVRDARVIFDSAKRVESAEPWHEYDMYTLVTGKSFHRSTPSVDLHVVSIVGSKRERKKGRAHRRT